MEDDRDWAPETIAIHAGHDPAAALGAVSVPIYQSSTFVFESAAQGAARFAGSEDGYKYTRLGNPTVAALEQAIARMESGAAALGTATGMAAVSTVLFSLLRSGDHVVGTDAVYGPTRLFVERELDRFGVRSDWVPTENPEAIRDAIRTETRLLWIETPANPTIKLTDIAICASLARAAGALLVVDNTFSSPMLQQPLALGADVVVHSMTKYLNGHSDVVAGMIVSGSRELHERIRPSLYCLGGTMDPHQAWLVLRGVRTLPMRLERAQRNAMQLAEWLATRLDVSWVSYPGLPSHPQHELAGRQMRGPGAMISFGVRGGLPAARRTIDAVRLARRAVSLGGIETLIEHPASMTHAGMPPAERRAAGILDDLVRLSVGCEAFEDLRDDLAQALRTASCASIPEV